MNYRKIGSQPFVESLSLLLPEKSFLASLSKVLFQITESVLEDQSLIVQNQTLLIHFLSCVLK